MTRPLLATSTDGVGTKVAIAQALDKHDTIGFDLVGMVVDDIVVCGAEPLFMTDYIATGKVVPERIAEIVARHRRAAAPRPTPPSSAARPPSTPACSSPTSTTSPARPPASSSTPTSSAPIGCARATSCSALASSGLHSNGYSLVRHVVAHAGWTLDRHVDEFGRTPRRGAARADPPLHQPPARPRRAPTASTCTPSQPRHGWRPRRQPRPGAARAPARAARPVDLDAAAGLPHGPADLGGVPRADLERTLNMGVGFVAVLPAESATGGVRTAGGARHPHLGDG